MITVLTQLEITYDKNLVLVTRREYIILQQKLVECERRHNEIFNPDIGKSFSIKTLNANFCFQSSIINSITCFTRNLQSWWNKKNQQTHYQPAECTSECRL